MPPFAAKSTFVRLKNQHSIDYEVQKIEENFLGVLATTDLPLN